MIDMDVIDPLKNRFQSTSSFLILLPKSPTYDQVSAALSLHLALLNKKKESHIVCAKPLSVEFGNLVGVDHVSNEIGHHSLQVTFDYDEKMVENVTYNIDEENKKFHLVVRPQKGHRPLDPTTVQYSHVGIDVEMMFLIGIKDFSDVQEFYETEEQAFHSAFTVAMNRTDTTFAQNNLNASDKSSVSEMMAELIESLELDVDADIATNLLSGIEVTSDNFRHYAVSAETFELVARLLRAGARRIKPAGGNGAQAVQANSLAQAFANQKQKAKETAAAGGTTTPQIQQVQRVEPTPGSLNYAPPVGSGSI